MKTYLACLACPILAILLLNYWLDAGNFRKAGALRRLALQQRGGELVAAPEQLDHRTWVRTRLVDTPEACPELLITGSSTVSMLSGAMFPGIQVFNAFVAGPSMEDLEALTNVLRVASCKPRWIVVGADPWWVANAALQDRRWIGWADDYVAYEGASRLRRLAIETDLTWSRFEDDLGFLTTRASLALFLQAKKGNVTRLISGSDDSLRDFCTTSASVGYYVRATDGHAVACDKFALSARERDIVASSYIQANPHSMGEWRELDKGRLRVLKRVVSDWTADRINVIILAPPFNPLTFDTLVRDPRIGPNLESLDAMLKDLHGGVRLLNLRDPSTVPCDKEEFLDSHHADVSCERKVAKRLMAAML